MVKDRLAPHNAQMQPFRTLLLVTAFAPAVSGCAQNVPPEVARAIEIPAPAGSMAPNLATGTDGTVVLSWIEPDADGHALRYAALGDGNWGEPRTVARGDNWFVNWADFPSVVPLSDSLWAAHWLASQPAGGYAYDVKVAISRDAGETWSDSFLPHFDNTPTEHGFVTLFPDAGGVGLVWLDGRKMVNEYDDKDVRASGMTLRAATFGEDLLPMREALVDDLTCDCCQTDIAITAEGPVAVYRDRTIDEIRDIYVSRRVFGEWQPGRAVSRDDWDIAACPVNGPVIRADEQDVVVAWFTAAGDAPKVKVAWSADAGKTFAEPVEADVDRPLGHVGGALLPDGDFVVSWHRATGNGGAELLLRRVATSGRLGATYRVEQAADIFAFSVPQLALVNDSVIAVWTTRVDGGYGIAGAAIPISLLD